MSGIPVRLANADVTKSFRPADIEGHGLLRKHCLAPAEGKLHGCGAAPRKFPSRYRGRLTDPASPLKDTSPSEVRLYA